VPVRIITTTQHRITEPAALETLSRLRNVQVKVVVKEQPTFHANGWLYKRPCIQHENGCSCRYIAVVGSSNITDSGLTGGFEWSLRTVGSPRLPNMPYRETAVDDFATAFNHYWQGADSFWGNDKNAVLLDNSNPNIIRLVCEQLTKKDRSTCSDSRCQQCIDHSRHLRGGRSQRPQLPRTGASAPAAVPAASQQYVAPVPQQTRPLPRQHQQQQHHQTHDIPIRHQPGPAPRQHHNTSHPKHDPQGGREGYNRLPAQARSPDTLQLYHGATTGLFDYRWLNLLDLNHKEVVAGLEGSTLLHCAAYGLNLGLVRELVKNGADTSARDHRGNTPLHRALQSDPSLFTNAVGDAYSLEDHYNSQYAVVSFLARYRPPVPPWNNIQLSPTHYCDALIADGRRRAAIHALLAPSSPGNPWAPDGAFTTHGIQAQSYNEAARALFERCRYPRWEEAPPAPSTQGPSVPRDKYIPFSSSGDLGGYADVGDLMRR
jgi:hypothetical protein